MDQGRIVTCPHCDLPITLLTFKDAQLIRGLCLKCQENMFKIPLKDYIEMLEKNLPTERKQFAVEIIGTTNRDYPE